MKTKLFVSLFVAAACFAAGLFQGPVFAQDDLRVMKSDGEPELVSSMFYDYLTAIARKELDERKNEIAAIKSPLQVA